MSRIAIYTIAKDEERNVQQFMAACGDAEMVLVGDTGSADRTVEIFSDLGATVVPITIDPWRFDVARNTMLSLVPASFDLCFALDLDEYPQTGWRDKVEPLWDGTIHNRLWFKYIHSFTATGAPANVGMKGFAHSRTGYVWKHRVHEDIYWQGNPAEERSLRLVDLVVEHRQAPKESRAAYIEMLKDECASETTTPRHVFWLCRELMRVREWSSLLASCQLFLSYKNTWSVERAHCLCMQAVAFRNTGEQQQAVKAYLQACDAAPDEREPWFEFARMYYGQEKWAQAYGLFSQCLQILHRADHYLTANNAWDYWPHYMAAVCMYNLGGLTVAASHIQQATMYTTEPTHVAALLQELKPHIAGRVNGT